jgi:hypothetical protein
MKRLRKAKGSCDANPVRFFLGAEYGDENGRPHYHALLFNVEFRDKLFFKGNKRGEPLFTSAELSSLWSCAGNSFGHCTLGEVTFDSAVYCAKYALKRLDGKRTAEYSGHDVDGVVVELEREFAVMSRDPGIGASYYAKYGQEVRDNDNIIVNGLAVRPPRFYDDRGAVADPLRWDEIKRGRKDKAWLTQSDNTPERLLVKEQIAYLSAEKKERKL